MTSNSFYAMPTFSKTQMHDSMFISYYCHNCHLVSMQKAPTQFRPRCHTELAARSHPDSKRERRRSAMSTRSIPGLRWSGGYEASGWPIILQIQGGHVAFWLSSSQSCFWRPFQSLPNEYTVGPGPGRVLRRMTVTGSKKIVYIRWQTLGTGDWVF